MKINKSTLLTGIHHYKLKLTLGYIVNVFKYETDFVHFECIFLFK